MTPLVKCGASYSQLKPPRLTSSGRVHTLFLEPPAQICSVAALLDYLARRGRTPGPLFQLGRRTFATNVQQALTSSGLDGRQFNSHSFRIGAATTASAAGLEDSTIKHLGRWKSDAHQGYIRPSPTDLTYVSSRLASKDSTS